MNTCVKNRKPCTNYTCSIKLVILILWSVCIPGWSQDQPEKTWVVVIDAGHGDRDPGALGSVSKEKNINLAIALKIGEYLENNTSNIKVLYSRKTDVFVGLKERAEFANKNKADLFISVHANWAPTKSIKGAETFVMGVSKDEQNLEVAMKENEVIQYEDDFSTKYEGFDPKSPESYIIFSLMQNVFQEQSLDLASKIQNQFKNRTGRIDRGVKQDGFWVLYMTSMPSVLIETGFITNPEEENYLLSKTGQDYIASAVFRATRDYINEVDKKSQISMNVEQEIAPAPGNDAETEVISGDSIMFMVQIASSIEKKDLNPKNFKGVADVTELAAEDRYRYASGSFRKFSEAVEYRKKISAMFPDAFVIAVRDNKILPLQQALESNQEK